MAVSKMNLGIPISDTKYLKSKCQEIACLEPFAGPKKFSAKKQLSNRELFEEKLRLKRAIQLAQLSDSSPFLSESNLMGAHHEMKCGSLSFRYAYQRSGVEISEKNLLRHWYSGLAASRANVEYQTYLSSCQGGLSTFFFALSQLDQKLSLELATPEVYWETQHFISRYTLKSERRLKREKITGRLLYIDSSTLKDDTYRSLGEKIRGAKLVAVDTTCFASQSADLAEIIRLGEAHGCPSVLFRSHNKLDCLGMEYGRLGSAVFLVPKRTPAASRDLVTSLIKQFKFYCRLFAVYSNITQIYPFIGNARFSRINGRRVARQCAANAKVGAHLVRHIAATKNDRFWIETFRHQLFFLIHSKKIMSEDETSRALRRLEMHMLSREIPHMIAATYPWDFTSINVITGQQELDNSDRKTIFRISVGDYRSELQTKTSAALTGWLNDLANAPK